MASGKLHIVDPASNRLNAAVRHCRIGKVKFKAAYPRHPFDLLPPFKNGIPYIWQPKHGEPSPIAWWQNPVGSIFACLGRSLAFHAGY